MFLSQLIQPSANSTIVIFKEDNFNCGFTKLFIKELEGKIVNIPKFNENNVNIWNGRAALLFEVVKDKLAAISKKTPLTLEKLFDYFSLESLEKWFILDPLEEMLRELELILLIPQEDWQYLDKNNKFDVERFHSHLNSIVQSGLNVPTNNYLEFAIKKILYFVHSSNKNGLDYLMILPGYSIFKGSKVELSIDSAIKEALRMFKTKNIECFSEEDIYQLMGFHKFGAESNFQQRKISIEQQNFVKEQLTEAFNVQTYVGMRRPKID